MEFEDNIFQVIGRRAEGLKNVIIAKKLVVELQTADLDHVLAAFFSGDGPESGNDVIIVDTLDESYHRQLNVPIAVNVKQQAD